MLDAEAASRQDAENQYAAALAALSQPVWPADHAPADPYGRTLQLNNGDLVLVSDLQGVRDLAQIAGKSELAQSIQVLVGTPQGSDIFNQIFGFDLLSTLAQAVSTRRMRELVRMCVVKALGQEPRIRQIQAAAFVDEPAFLVIHPEIKPQQQAGLATEQKTTRRWRLDVLLDTRLGDQVRAGIEGIGPGEPRIGL
jgi:phage baseplate assembly protein W